MVKKFLWFYKFSLLMIYLLVTFLSFNLTNWWWIWTMLELMNWSFMFFIKNFNLMIMFLMWQSLSSLMFLWSFLILKNKLMILMSMLLKMSLPPFHIWFWSLLTMWSWKPIIVFLNLHKYPSMIILMNYLPMSIINFVIFLPIIVFLNFWLNSNFKGFIWIMSINDTCWLIMSYYMMMNVMLIYLMMNFILMMMMIYVDYNNKTKLNMMFYIIMLLMALPPFSSFQIKWLILMNFSINLLWFLIINLIIFIFLMLWVIFSISIFNKSDLYVTDLYLWVLTLISMMWLIFL